MEVREKLVELIEQSGACFDCFTVAGYEKDEIEKIASYLIAHGVTVQEWISVKDGLPTAEDALLDSSVYAYTKSRKVLVLHYQYVCRRSDYILCWMPIAMPQPPNEVEQ